MNKLIKLSNNDWVITIDKKIKKNNFYISFETNYATHPKERWVLYNLSSATNGSNPQKVIAHSNHPELKKINFNGLKEEFGIVNVEKLAENEYKLLSEEFDRSGEIHEENLQLLGHRRTYKKGFQKAQELNNRLYTLEDMKKAFNAGADISFKGHTKKYNGFDEYLTKGLGYSWDDEEGYLPKTEFNVEVEILEHEVKILNIIKH